MTRARDVSNIDGLLTAKGDIYAATGAGVVVRQGIGANGTVLTANSAQDDGLEWATPAAGGMTLLSTTSLSGASVTISSINQTYNSLFMVITGVTNATATNQFRCAPNNQTTISNETFSDGATTWQNYQENYVFLSSNGPSNGVLRTSNNNAWEFTINNYTSATSNKSFNILGAYVDGNLNRGFAGFGQISTTSPITSLVFSNSGGNLSTGTVLLYGVK